MTTYPNAVFEAGPPSKQNGGLNPVRGAVCHSMVGPYSAAKARLDDAVTAGGRASWHYSVLQSGEVIQHYGNEARCWHAGSAYNNSTVGIEHEGGGYHADGSPNYSEPLTPPQLAASVALVRWLSQTHNFPLVRGVGLWEHNEVSGAPTACPSGRIPWDAYTLGDRMYTDSEIDAKVGAVLAALVEANRKLDALQTSTDYLAQIAANLAPRVAKLEGK